MLIHQLHGDDKTGRERIVKALGLKTQWDALPWPLPSMRRIDDMQMWSRLTLHSPKAWIYAGRQRIDGEGADVTLLWDDTESMTNGGFAVLRFEKRIDHYSWMTCDHSFSRRSVGNCLHLYTCSKCGASYEVDSSG